MKITDVYFSKYVKASEVKPGTVITRTIAEVELSDFPKRGGAKNETEKKAVLYFRSVNGSPRRGIILNYTQVETLTAICGSEETDDWIGKKVEVFTLVKEVFGEPALTFSFRLPAAASEDKKP